MGLLWCSGAVSSWAASIEFFSTNATWRLWKGRTEASSPDVGAWRRLDFDASGFEQAPAPFTYGEGYTYGTVLSDMRYQYSCIFLRRTFVVSNVMELAALRFGAKVDDGFVVWINGLEMQRVNVPGAPGSPLTISTLASGAASEPVPFLFYDWYDPPSFLVEGTNVIAVQVFNSTLDSSDLVFDCSLTGILVDTTPPRIAAVVPPPGPVTALTQITVRFTEPVSGVNADDLLINGWSARSVAGAEDTYTFTFAQPPYGGVWISWAANPAITDLALPPNFFDPTGPGATWQYELVDAEPPRLTAVSPPPGATVRSLGQIEITFDEPVTGVDAADLLINGRAATNLIARPGCVFLFQFAPPAPGLVQVGWAAAHGIRDLATVPNAFAGGSWSYQLDPDAPPAEVVINEIAAANRTGLTDEDGQPQDWIELYNRGTRPVDLTGWSLSDDPDWPGQWVFPAVVLPPGQFLVVFASGKDRRQVGGTNRLHTNFKLGASGEFLGLYSSDAPRVLVDGFEPQYPEQRNGISWGRDSTGALRYFTTPTPGAPNGPSTIRGVAEPVHFSVQRGLFTQPFTLTLSCPTPGAQIRYTTNGTEPTWTTGYVYTGPLQINSTRLVRAAAFRADLLPSRVTTHSYLFNLPAAYRTVPIISIVTDPENLTGPNGIIGISNVVQQSDGTWVPRDATGYHNPSKHGLAWERPTSVEWIRPEDNSGFQIDCGIRVHGSDYQRPRTTPSSKFSFRLYFRGDYGPGRLEYPLFPLTSVRSFDQLVLRAGFNDTSNPFIRDELTRRLFHDMGQVAPHGTFAILLLNGVAYTSSPYYNPCERVHEEFMQAYLGGSDEWDVVGPTFAQGAGEPGVIDGDRTDFRSLVNYINTQPTTSAPVYLEIARRLDLTNFVDYLLLNVYTAMGDWPQNNFRAAKDRTPGNPGSIWRFVVWDAEWAMGIYGRGVTSNMFTANGPGPNAGGLASVSDSEIAQMYQRLYLNPEFRLLWADRIHKHMFHGGALTDTNIVARFNQMRAELSALIPNMATDILTTWVPQRRPILFGHFDQFGLMASSNAPVFNQHGGRVPRGFVLSLSAGSPGGTIWFTTNGGDPRVMFTGAVASNAVAYTGPLALDRSVTVRARTLHSGRWSALTEATFEVATLGVPLRITELNYHPPANEGNATEFIEVLNVGSAAVDLSGMTFEGVSFRFPEGTILQPGAVLVVVSDRNPALFAARYPGVAVAGYFGGALNNAGERIALLDRFGNTIVSVDYDDAGGWPTEPDGGGYTLEIIDPYGDPDDPANWRASAEPGGTPGRPPAAATLAQVRLNELMAQNTSAVNHAGTYPDWIELYNAGPSGVDLGGWSLSKDGRPGQFVFPAGTLLPAGGYLVVWCDAVTNTTPGLHTGFTLEVSGGAVFLFNAATQRVDAVSFGQQLTNYSLGRVGGEWVLTTPTPGAANLAAALAPATELVINEWLANSLPGQPDWIELYNRSSTLPVALRGLTLATSNAVFQITALAFVPPRGYIVLLADEGVGPAHVDFRLPAAGGMLALYDTAGFELNRITYGAQVEGVSRGRLPDGSSTFTNFVATASPGAPNYAPTYTGPVLNEVLARNQGAVTNARGTPDFIELFNPNATAWDLSGMSLSVDVRQPGQWVFPAGSLLPGRSYLVLWADGTRPPSAVPGDLNLGQGLDGESGGLYLFDAAGQLVSSVEYGPQVPDLPIGLAGGVWRLLTRPTPGEANAAVAALGSASTLRINEWMALPERGPDWFELFNPASLPVELSGLLLTDDPSMSGTNRFVVPPLSFIAAQGFVRWVADGDVAAGRNHVSFRLDGLGDTIRIYGPAGTNLIDSVSFGRQRRGVSEGRLPDGAVFIVPLMAAPTPAAPNYLPLPNLLITEVLLSAAAPEDHAIELHNPSDAPVTLEGWYLSDSPLEPRKYRLGPGTVVPPRGFLLLAQRLFSQPSPTGFVLSPARGGEVWLAQADAGGNLTGYRATARYGPAEPGQSFGPWATRLGVEFAALSQPTPGGPNTTVRLGPVVLNEIMYHPPPGVGGLAEPEYIELVNVTAEPVPLFDPIRPTNTWRLAGGIRFAFPPNLTLPAGGVVVVVNFDPAADPVALARFRAQHNVPSNVPVLGPFAGKLDNAGELVELLKPGAPLPPGQPEAGQVPWVSVDRVQYDDEPPWPSGPVEGGGLALHRRSPLRYGNDPESWMAAVPSPGDPRPGDWVSLPVILQSPQSVAVASGSVAALSVQAQGDGPLQFQWRLNGIELADQTNATLLLDYVVLDHEGDYDVYVSNPAGSVFSPSARLQVDAPPVVLEPPVSVTTYPGSNVLFSVTAVGSAPLRYQWRFNGVPLPGANGPSLLLTNVALSHLGAYSVVISNRVGWTEASAYLTVLVRASFVVQPVSQEVPAGGTVVLSASWIGTPPMGHRWRRGSTTLAFVLPTDGFTWVPVSNGFIWASPTSSFLVLTNLSLSLTGSYTVVVSNQVAQVLSRAAVVTLLTDSDGDGLPDAWERAHAGFDPANPADGARDDDGDGLSNAAEFAAGTDYLDPASVLKLRITTSDVIQLQFEAVSNRTYTVEFTDSLGPPQWRRLVDVLASTNTYTELILDPSPAPQRFYRLVTPVRP